MSLLPDWNSHDELRAKRIGSPATSGRSCTRWAVTFWHWPTRTWRRGESCSTSPSRSWQPASPVDARRIRPVRVALQSQRDDLLAFAGLLGDKLAGIARADAVPESLVREACVLNRLSSTSPVCWQGWNRLCAQTRARFHALFDAVSHAMAGTPRSSLLVEDLNSRLRTYFTLRRRLGRAYPDLLRFFLNHCRFLRSRHAKRQGRSPRELMAGQGHPHWLTLLGFGPLQPRRA